MRRIQSIVGLGLAIIVLAGVLGLWLWGKPRETVARPDADTPPAGVVRTFAKALNDRDFNAAKAAVVGDRVGVDAGWWSLHGPRVEDLRIIRTGPVTTGAQCATEAAAKWKKCVQVDTEATFRHVKGMTEGSKPDHEPWSYYLVRNKSSQTWRILDWGKG
jgi:hypothetical protein